MSTNIGNVLVAFPVRSAGKFIVNSRFINRCPWQIIFPCSRACFIKEARHERINEASAIKFQTNGLEMINERAVNCTDRETRYSIAWVDSVWYYRGMDESPMARLSMFAV